MRIRFTGSVSVLGGPRYHAGEVIETDPHVMTEAKARSYISGGWAVEVMAPLAMPNSRDIKTPPIDRMVRGPAVRK